MKIRSNFVSNSSSTSFCVINKGQVNLRYLKDTYSDYIINDTLKVDMDFGNHEFGWSRIKYDSFGDKLIFAYIQAITANGYDSTTKKYLPNKDFIDLLEEVVKETLGVAKIEWELPLELDDSDDEWSYCYVDHQSASYEGQNIEIFESRENLYNFLFSNNSYIQGGNDN